MLIQQTVYPNTEEILIEQRQHFSQRISLGKKKLVQIFVVLLFLHNHTHTRILSSVFFLMYLTSFAPLLDPLEPTLFFSFFFFV